jgi:hypothetical protein
VVVILFYYFILFYFLSMFGVDVTIQLLWIGQSPFTVFADETILFNVP